VNTAVPEQSVVENSMNVTVPVGLAPPDTLAESEML
jgi:hypothetical protein